MSSSSSDLDCPITGTRFVDPVIAQDGQTYERSAIQSWFDRGNRTSPISREVIGTALITNYDKRRQLASTAIAVASATATGGAAAASVAVATSVAASAATVATVADPIPEPFSSARPSVGARRFTGKNGKHYLHIQATVASPSPRPNGTDYIFSVDTSGSMESVAWVKVDKGEMGATRLNLCIHLIKTMAAMLTPRDRIAIVQFSEKAQKVMDLTPMTAAGKSSLSQKLAGLRADGCTHLYGGVEEAAAIASSEACRGRRIVGIILTDGVPTESIVPVTGGRSTMPMIQERIRVANPWSFHAIGFSSDINSRLLEQLANWGNGRMLFVPSGDMVSTNGINLTAFEKTVASLGTTMTYTVNGIATTFHTGCLGLKQNRNFMIPIAADAVIGEIIVVESDILTAFNSIELTDCRNDFVETLTRILDTHSVSAYAAYNPIVDRPLSDLLMAFHGRHSSIADPGVMAILRDVVSTVDGEGQVRLALQHAGDGNWGMPYLRAYRDHMRSGVCMNFKDPGLKIFETPEFMAFQADGDTAFAAIPAMPIQRKADITADAAARAALASMSASYAFNNASGGCFEGSMPVRMMNGAPKEIRDIRRGDSVWTPTGPATVIHAIELNTYQPSQPMVQLTPAICVTAWHPCRPRNFGPLLLGWDFPSNIVQFQARPIRTIYNLVLNSGHIIESGDYQFVTLGHGFQEGILKHAWFGGQEIVRALEAQPGGGIGRPVYRNLVAVKDHTGLIVNWIDQA